MYEIRRSTAFDTWLTNLSDSNARARIVARIDRFALGNPGDVKPVGGGVSELRIDYGPGYRVYYARTDRVVYLLLCGGTKATQDVDIKRAIEMAAARAREVSAALQRKPKKRKSYMARRTQKTERFARYDSADYLKTPEDVAEYLVAAFEAGGDDAAYMAHVIGIAARAHGGMTKLAKETGMTRAGLYKALSKDGNPSFDTIVKAMRVLGVRLVPQLTASS